MKSIPQYLLVLVAAAACRPARASSSTSAPVESRTGAAAVPGNQNAARDAAATRRPASRR